jgi:hypothetical protein
VQSLSHAQVARHAHHGPSLLPTCCCLLGSTLLEPLDAAWVGAPLPALPALHFAQNAAVMQGAAIRFHSLVSNPLGRLLRCMHSWRQHLHQHRQRPPLSTDPLPPTLTSADGCHAARPDPAAQQDCGRPQRDRLHHEEGLQGHHGHRPGPHDGQVSLPCWLPGACLAALGPVWGGAGSDRAQAAVVVAVLVA